MADPLFVDRVNGNYRLLAASPAVDSGNDDHVATLYDLDGAPRVQDGNDDGSAMVDVGAYEFSPDFDGDGSVDWQDADDDDDAEPDASDCSPRGKGVSKQPDPVERTLRYEKQGNNGKWKWDRSRQGHTYTLYRGTIKRPWTFNETCIENENPSAQSNDDGVTPAPGAGYYYLTGQDVKTRFASIIEKCCTGENMKTCSQIFGGSGKDKGCCP